MKHKQNIVVHQCHPQLENQIPSIREKCRWEGCETTSFEKKEKCYKPGKESGDWYRKIYGGTKEEGSKVYWVGGKANGDQTGIGKKKNVDRRKKMRSRTVSQNQFMDCDDGKRMSTCATR